MTDWTLPYKPSEVQLRAHALKVDELLAGGAAGGGKLLAVDTPVLTTAGWKRHGDLTVGDYVYGRHGQPVRVLASYTPPTPHHYLLTFSTGETIRAGAGHLWAIQTDRDRQALTRAQPEWKARRRASRASRAANNPKSPHRAQLTAQRNKERAEAARAGETRPDPWDYTQVVDTDQVAALHGSEKKALTVPRPLPIMGGARWPSDLPPWVMGMWLGDGTTNGAGITQGREDSAVLTERMADNGFTLYRVDGGDTYFFRHTVTGDTLDTHLTRVYGSVHSRRVKRIPDWVYTTSYADRLAVAQGLIDADGHINERGQLELSLSDEDLFEDAVRLLATLGVRVSQQRGQKAGYRDKTGAYVPCKPRHRLKASTEVPLATYPRKLARIDTSWVDPSHTTRRSTIKLVSVQKVPADVPANCITVDDPSGIYLAGDTLVPTHNSALLLGYGITHCLAIPGAKVGLFRRSLPELEAELEPRLLEWVPDTVARYNSQKHVMSFPNGSQLRLGYLEAAKDIYRYQGVQFSALLFDELTQFDWDSYTYLKSRLRVSGRTLEAMDALGLTPRVISTTNPGGKSHHEVKEYFVDVAPPNTVYTDPKTGRTRAYVPFKFTDNAHIDTEQYGKELAGLPEHLRRALMDGDWGVLEGTRFPQFRESVHVIRPEDFPIPVVGVVRAVGVDYGTRDPMAAVWAAKVGDTIVVYRDHVEKDLAASQQAERVLELESEEERLHSDVTVALDPNGWARNPAFGGVKLGPGSDEAPLGSIAHYFKQALGDRVVKGWNPRVQGWAILDELMIERDTGMLDENGDPVKLPRILIYDNCRDVIKALQAAPRSKRNPEDVDTSWSMDHQLDALRYCCAELLGRSYRSRPSGHERMALEASRSTVTGDLGSRGF